MKSRGLPVLTFLLMFAGVFNPFTVNVVSATGIPETGFRSNFTPEYNSAWVTDRTSGACGYGGCGTQLGDTDPTPFALNVVDINGVSYFHTIVGDPAAGFAMESYTTAGAVNISNSNSDYIGTSGGGFSPDAGGNETSIIGFTDPTGASSNMIPDRMNSANPLGDYRVSGTGSADPRRTVFHMFMSSAEGDMSLEVFKPYLDKKPMISQSVQDEGMISTFVTDERGLNYNQDGTAAPMTNTLVLDNSSIPAKGGNFTMAMAQQSLITAGRFTYTPGTAWGPNPSNPSQDPSLGWYQANSSFGFGTYNYVDSQGFDPLNFNWSSVFDYSQNAISCGNFAAPSTNTWTREQQGDFGGSCFNKP